MERVSLQPLEIFFCYAREDQDLRDKLDKHLAGLRHAGLITTWYDGAISPGTFWEQAIETHLRSAHIILLLVSPDFISSDYCYTKEMQYAFQRHNRKEVRIIPILLRPADWSSTPLSSLQALPSNALPVTSWPNQDEALEEIVKGIHWVVNDLYSQQITAHDPAISTVPPIVPYTKPSLEPMLPSHPSSSSITSPQQISQLAEPVSTPRANVAISRTGEERLKRLPVFYLVATILLVFSVVVSIPISIRNFQIAHDNATATTINTKSIFDADSTETAEAALSIIPKGWKLVLDDPLRDNTKGYQWDIGTGPNHTTSCEFFQNAYHVSDENKDNNTGCVARKNDFTNFFFQVQMTIIRGDCGGIFFRDTPADPNSKLYAFQACQNGFMNLLRYTSSKDKDSTGIGVYHAPESNDLQVNHSVILAVLANESDIKIYINQQLVYTASDSTLTHGYIAVAAMSGNDPTEVIYNNAKVWVPSQ